MIASVKAALSVLRIIAGDPGIGLSQLARTSGLQKSRIFRILETLVAEGFVYQAPDKGYQLGMQSMIIGQAARKGTGLVKSAERLIEEFAQHFDENIQIRVRDGATSVQIYQRRCNQRLRVESSAGNSRPLGVGAAGRVLLAYLPDAEIAELEINPMDKTEREVILSHGYAHSRGELTHGIEAVAVPIFGVDNYVLACLSASVPSARMSIDYQNALIQGLQELSATLASTQ